ncbi:MAG: carbohydrate ABC transporter permease [Christensenellales bacterium]
MKKRVEKPIRWITPALISMMLVQFLPGFFSIFMSFTDLGVTNLRELEKVNFVGIKNFQNIFTPGTTSGNQFIPSLLGTVEYTFICAIVGYSLGLGAALLMNQNFRGRGLVRALLLVPWIVPNVVSAFIWRLMFMSDYGVINKILRFFHITETNIIWLSEKYALFALIVAHTWSALPFAMLYILAGLQTIPQEQYEACKIDGGNAFQRFRYITIPGIRNISIILLLLTFIRGSGEFTLPYAMYGSSVPAGKANLISVLIYQTSFQTWDLGAGAAMSTVVLIIMMILAIFYLKAVSSRKNLAE